MTLDDIEGLPHKRRTKRTGQVGRPPSLSVSDRKERELQVKTQGLQLKKRNIQCREREIEQKDELLDILRRINESLEVLTAAVVAHGTASAAIAMRRKTHD